MKKKVTIAASILTADFLHLKKVLDKIIASDVEAIHFDVMDNHFVPNLSFGTKILSDITNYVTKRGLIVDCHMMVKIDQSKPLKVFFQPFLAYNINSFIIHYEALSEKQLTEFINSDFCIKKGLAINPATKVDKILPYLPKLDYILLMSVNPGFGAQTFITSTYQKIKFIASKLKHSAKHPIIIVDGGINNVTGPKCIAAGANYLVSGSYLLDAEVHNETIAERIKKLIGPYPCLKDN